MIFVVKFGMNHPSRLGKILHILAGMLLLSMAQDVAAQQTKAPSDREIAAHVDHYMRAAVEFEQFSGTILIARDGATIVSKGYGLANVEFDAPNTPQTVFRLASLSKQFTAAAILILQERGQLNVNDPACKHLAQCPPAWQPLTIRHLLTNTHGIPAINFQDIGALRALPIPHDQWYDATSKKPLLYTPGEKFQYLNPGYTLLGLIIERVSGKSYGDFLQDNIFGPLEMQRSGYEEPLRIIKNRAVGYRHMPDTPIANLPYREVVRMFSAGGIFSTSEDLLRWSNALATGTILSRKSTEEMFTPFRDMQPGKGYAYGLWSSQTFGRRRLAHGGNATGFINYIAFYPEDRVTVIVLSNNERGSAGKINDTLSAIAFGQPYELPSKRTPISLNPEILNQYVGVYQVQYPETEFTFEIENGRLMMSERGLTKEEIFPESNSNFFSKTFDIQIEFVDVKNQKAAGIKVYQNDNTVFETMIGNRVGV